MDPAFDIHDEELPLPPGVGAVDLEAEFVKLLVRCSKLENRLEDQEKSHRDADRKLLESLLDVVDALDRILDKSRTGADPGPVLERQTRNIETTRRLFLQRLAQVGVRPLVLTGQVADPQVADLSGYQDDPTVPDETVVKEVVKAYAWNAEVLRRGQVIVTRNL